MDPAEASNPPAKQHSLERSISQQSNTSLRSYRSGTLRTSRSRPRKLTSQPSSSASSIAASDKSLTSFPSFSPESPEIDRFGDGDEEERLGTATQQSYDAAAHLRRHAATVGAGERSKSSIFDTLTGRGEREGLFEDAPLAQKVPGSLHQADDEHIQRLIARSGAVGLVRQLAEDLARRDDQMTVLRRKADDRERALRRIVRECGLSNLDLETRLRVVEDEMRSNERAKRGSENGLSELMSDAMQDSMMGGDYNNATIRASSTSMSRGTGRDAHNGGAGTARGWKDFIWGTGTARKKASVASSVADESVDGASVLRSHSSLERRPTLQEGLFDPPEGQRETSRSSSMHGQERKPSASFASRALRMVAGGTAAAATRESEFRGRASSGSSQRAASTRAISVGGHKKTPSSVRAVSVAGGPKALMSMKRPTPVPAPVNTKSQAKEMWETMLSSPTEASGPLREESYGPVEMDAIRPPESQPPTLSHVYNNNKNHTGHEFLTDRFGFIYDQRRKKRQREAAQMARQLRQGQHRKEMLANGRAGISPSVLEDAASSERSVSEEGYPQSPSSSLEERNPEEPKPKRWQDYLKIATFQTELLSHTPGMDAPSLEVMEGTDEPAPAPRRPSSIRQTSSGLVPTPATAAVVVDSATTEEAPSDGPPDAIPVDTLMKEETEPVRLLLQQLSEVHDALQREKEVRWNDFLRKVRAERKREGEAAIAAAAAAAEARFEQPNLILPETYVADGEMIGVSNLGNKGKVGRAKWKEFKNLVLGGIPVAYRAKIWSECSGATALRVPGCYEDLVARNSADDDASVVAQIQMDIHRTLTDNIFFRKGPGVEKLNEVLVAYARRNKDVGYCQGMNLIAANLLLIMPSAEDAFWVLTSIIETILPAGYYDGSLTSSRADQQVLRHYVTTLLPRLSAHLDALSIDLDALTFQWFLSVFTDCLCAEALFRVWDVVFCTNDGATFLFQVALALLKLNEGNLVERGTAAEVYTYIGHHMTEHAISIDGLMQASEGLRRVVRREDVEARRAAVIAAEKATLAAKKTEGGPGAAGGRKKDEELTLAEPRPIEE